MGYIARFISGIILFDSVKVDSVMANNAVYVFWVNPLQQNRVTGKVCVVKVTWC